MAQRSGAVLFPTVYAAEVELAPRSWDRQLVPLPFSRVVAPHLPPRCVPANLDAGAVERVRAELERELARRDAQLDAELAGQPRQGTSSRSEGG